MINLETAIQILSPYDLLEVTIEESQIVRKDKENFDPASLLIKKANDLLFLHGKNCLENPTYSKISNGKFHTEIPEWNDALSCELKNNPKYSVKVTDLDNNNNAVTVSSSIHLAISNCVFLTKEQIKEIKCAVAFTLYGQIEINQ